MSRIEINAGGRHIIVDHQGGELEPMRQTALSIWEATEGPAPSPGPAVGFQAEKSPQWDHDRARPVRAGVTVAKHIPEPYSD